MVRVLVLLAACVGSSASAAAPPSMPNPVEMQKALTDAQAAANRPGDESLTCEALQTELLSVAKNPALQSTVEKAGVEAKEKQAAMEEAARKSSTQSALTLFSSIAPGGGWASMAAATAQAEQGKAQFEANMQQRMQQAQQMMTLLPHLLRGQRVIELAQKRKCEWLGESNTAPQ